MTQPVPPIDPRIEPALAWFRANGWTPFPFQIEAWEAYLDGRSGLVHSPTGTGKTLAAWMGPLVAQASSLSPEHSLEGCATKSENRLEACATMASAHKGLKVLWITPLKALASDTLASLQLPVPGLGLDWTAERRAGDSTAPGRAKEAQPTPDPLVTPPESLSLMLTREDVFKVFADLQLVVVDEWHELMASKRGVQTELGLARLLRISPKLRTWGVSATLGNLGEALDTLLGVDPNA